MVAKKHPDIAEALLSTVVTDIKDVDHSDLSERFTAFCSLMEINKDDYFGPVYKTSKVDMRRMFIAAMLHLYFPDVYFHPIEEINLRKRGFVNELGKVLGQHAANISVMIREVIIWEKEYDDFRSKVIDIVEKLKSS